MEELLSSLGKVCAVIGAQWGDEGKGKAIDILSAHYDLIARACGGANAGHTIVVKGAKHVFHLLPAGSLHEGKPVFLGSGMVLHLPTLLEEIRTLREAGIDIVPRLFLCEEAHIVFDYHKEIDAVAEERRSGKSGGKIGTTKRGIGPAYVEKAARTGMRLRDLRALATSGQALHDDLSWRKDMAQQMYGVAVDVKKEEQQLLEAAALLSDRIRPVTFLLDVFGEGKRILIEGAQAALLDLDHGTYPYVTSSSTTAAGALQGLGLPPRALASCIGVAKAYCTRVGEGEFPTEVTGATGDRLRERGGEFGATTGRPRRCGWLSLPDLVFSARLNGFTHWNITKLDVLDEEETVPVGIEVGEDGRVRYENLPGWKTSTRGIRTFAKLPRNAKNYLRFIEEKTRVPVALIGTGPGREEMIVR